MLRVGVIAVALIATAPVALQLAPTATDVIATLDQDHEGTLDVSRCW